MTTIIFDTETTGLPNAEAAPLSSQPHIIEFAAIKVDDELNEIERLEFLCNPGVHISDKITEITRLTNADLEDKPPFEHYISRLNKLFLGTNNLIAHNLAFDRNLLKFELLRLNRLTAFPWPPNQICTVEKTFHIHGYRLNLNKLHTELIGTEHVNGAHRAMADVEALLRCVTALTSKSIITLGAENGC